MTKKNYDFSGYATKANVKCGDGRVIMPEAFKESNGKVVPLVWQHMHEESTNVLGHALLEHRPDGVYAYCSFNESVQGKNAKLLVQHGDITALSIYANGLVEKSKNVVHGVIREVSLVLAGANPGAVIENVGMAHADGSVVDLEDEAVIFTSFEGLDYPENIQHAESEDSEETVGDVFNTLSEKQKTAVAAIIAEIMDEESDEGTKEEVEHSIIDEGEQVMKTNVFDGSAMEKETRKHLTHDQIRSIFDTAQKVGSLKAAVLQHAGTYGIDNIDYLFPDAKTLTNEPSLISRDMEWVPQVINGTRHTPFSRIKTIHADITVETARALGYVKGNLKKEEVFALLRRITTPTTIYKKQKLDRDDIIDITDLDVVAWLKREMRMMLDEEIARALLVGDGRDPVADVDDKIDETHIRPIWKDDDLYAHKVTLASDDTVTEMIDAIITARTNYKGSGSPVLYTTTAFLTSMLLLKDSLGYRIYKTEQELAAALRVSKIVEVPVMDGLVRTEDLTDYKLMGIIVNLRDYALGADKGGQVSMFDDFDIDYNQYKYLMETRLSGALLLPKSALVIEQEVAAG